MTQNLFEIVKSKDSSVQTLMYGFYVQKILDRHPNNILAIMVYGSVLNPNTKTATSTPDFYVVVDNYKSFYEKSLDRFLNQHLPPNIYHLQANQTDFKYCVISLEDLQREVSENAKDVYHLGRFSKTMGIVWARDDDARKQIVEIQVSAIRAVTKKVLMSLKGTFSLEEFIKRSLFLSYQGDVRIESPDKVDRLMNAEKKYYEDIFSTALAEQGYVRADTDTAYSIDKSPMKKAIDQISFKKFISSSKIRAQSRWPKNMFTVDNWLDYILAKIERSHGIKIEMSPHERKYWFIYGWKHFIKLTKSKLIK